MHVSALDRYRNGSFSEASVDQKDQDNYNTQKVADYYYDNAEVDHEDGDQDYYSTPVDDNNYGYPYPEEPNHNQEKSPYDYPVEEDQIAAPTYPVIGQEEQKETGASLEEQKVALTPSSGSKIADVTRPIIEYDPNAKITVSEPKKQSSGVVGNHTEYRVKGNNSGGDFDENRRYKEFYSLRNLLNQNWPGFFIPAIPPKVKIGKMENSVVQERCYLFNRFMKDVSETPHLWESDEVKTFIKPNMGVGQALSLIAAPTPESIFERVTKTTGINHEEIDDAKVNRYTDSIREFVISSKDIFPLLAKFKNCITQLEKQRRYQLEAYKDFSEFLSQYESTTMNVYSSDSIQGHYKMISDTDNNTMRAQIEALSEKIDNPFIRFKYWVKEEIIDLHALLQAIGQKNSLESKRHKLQNKIKNANSELEKLNAGKKTFKTLFKSQSGKASTITSLTTFIAQAEKDIEIYEKLIKIVTVHLFEKVIPEFKAKKVKGYVSSLKEFSDSESKNSNELYRCWSSVLQQIQQTFEKSS
ncbi:unnamed protein product [Moneuplotes crassus]|uniref:PX domain-containing protein n=1 Tax=Euplotes crassus TaxID=5936 RepID=A0AAD1X5H4_EUPCR|nr:unnamed protein product [Moneuplotes crassus]